MVNGAPERNFRVTVDWRIVAAWLILMIFGWMNIYAAVRGSEPAGILDWSFNCGKQAVWIVGALIIAAVVLFIVKPYFWESVSGPAYFAALVLLVAVIFLSSNVKGSHSWFNFGPVSFQPAELSKITTSLMLATLMSLPGFRMEAVRHRGIAVGLILLPMLIIVAESEAGSALVYAGFIFVLYREGLSGWWIALGLLAILLFVVTLKFSWWVSMLLVLLALAAVARFLLRQVKTEKERQQVVLHLVLAAAASALLIFATDFIFQNVLKDHQRGRIEVLLGMRDDPQGLGYNVHQSLIAIGSGGFSGKGYLQGTQTTFGFVPEQSTDFIFCTVGEEWGFVGSILVLALYALMIYWIIGDAEKARSSFTRIYGYCVASILFMHVIINVGMTLGLMPVIGIPLPLFSYGGSSLWSFTLLIFIFLALDRQEKKYF